MTDLISRADAIEEISKGVWNVHELVDRIKALPSADTVPIEKYHELQHQFVMLGATFADLTEVVRCKDCRHANECHKSVQYTRNEQSTITLGYTPIEWCSRGERRKQ